MTIYLYLHLGREDCIRVYAINIDYYLFVDNSH